MRPGGDEYSKTERTATTGFYKVPKPPKWGNAGSIVGDNNGVPFSIGWRLLDSQYFGIPQRRKRIFLILDFGGRSSEEILFECESVSGDFESGAGEVQNTAAAVERSAKNANTDVGAEPVLQKTYSIIENVINRGHSSGGNGIGVSEDICYTLTTAGPHAIANCKLFNRSGRGVYRESDLTGTLLAHLGKQGDDLVVNLGSQGDRIYCNAEKSCSITAQGGGGGARTGIYFNDFDFAKSKQALCDAFQTDNPLAAIEEIIESEGIEELLRRGYELHINGVRRLTPLECERLMGYGNYYTNPGIIGKDGKPKAISDNARYRALGNPVCVPCVVFLLERLKHYHFKS
jgi:DNA (cytosine-5)-methyltransferase 1